MLASESLSTNAGKVLARFKAPFSGGTQRFLLNLETAVSPPTQLAGCHVVGLGFVQLVRLQAPDGTVEQGSFCKALGLGLRFSHPRILGKVWELKAGYYPMVHGVRIAIRRCTGTLDSALHIQPPQEILFR